MSKRGGTRKKQFRLEPLSRTIRKFVDELVALGCDRQRLLWRIESFLEKYETREKQQLDEIFDRRDANLAVKSAIDQIREAATKIRLLQTAYPLLPIALKAFLKDLTPAQRRALAVYEELPFVLEQFASAAQYELDLIGPLLSRDGMKWSLIKYVEDATGEPHFKTLSFLLSAAVDELRLNRPSRNDLSPDALRNFWRRHKKNLPKTTGRKIFDFLLFLARLTD